MDEPKAVEDGDSYYVPCCRWIAKGSTAFA